MEESLYGKRGLIIVVTAVILAILNPVLKAKGYQGRYAILHAAGNAIATVLTFPGMIHTLLHPLESIDGPPCINGYCVAVGIHVFHVIFFQPLPYLEWLHHILMIGLVGPVVFHYATGSICDYCCFFLSGFPGGISYVLVGMRKNGALTRLSEKRYNAAINTWIRTPFTIVGAFIMYQLTLYKELSLGQKGAALVVAGLVAWNGIFFGRRVAENYGNNREPKSEPHVS